MTFPLSRHHMPYLPDESKHTYNTHTYGCPACCGLTSAGRLSDVAAMASPVTISAFYKFAPVAEPTALRDQILSEATRANVRGIILVAPEGINGTIAGSADIILKIMHFIRDMYGFSELEWKLSEAQRMPFRKLRVRLKKEIVTFGQPLADPNRQVGTYVEPSDWNTLIGDPEVLLIDTRNSFEIGFGTFEGAVDPGTRHFSEFAAYVRSQLDPSRHRKVAMFCTGGIRCEKASSFMKSEGFPEVYHLKGGILKYLEEIPSEQSRWKGGCFVFDERIAVGHGVRPTQQRLCLSCNSVVSDEATRLPGYEDGVSCPACFAGLTEAQLRSARERQKQMTLARRAHGDA